MRKQLRQYLRRSLCGVLSAAMILTGSAIPDLAVHAAQTNVEDFTEADEQINETPSTGTNENDVIDNPDADNEAADGVENIDQDNSDQKDEQGEDSSEDDGKAPDDADSEDGDDKKNDEEAVEDETELQKVSKGVMTVDDGTTAEIGTLVNGDFETFEQVDGVYVPAAWKFSPAYTGKDGGGFETQTIDKDKYGDNSLYIYKESETEISVSQVIPNMEPGAYMVALDAGGVYGKDQIVVKVESVEKAAEDDEDYTTVLKELTLTPQSLGECDAWGKWNPVETEIFEVKVPDGKAEVNVKITISGKIGVNNKAEQIHIDNVKFVTYKLADLNDLLTSAGSYQQEDYTEETWYEFNKAKEEAQALVADSATSDDTKAFEIMQAYMALEKTMGELVPLVSSSTVTFYYYAGDIDDEIGLYYWDDSGESNISTTANPIEDWYVWAAGDTYKMTEVTGYAGWYSIPIKFKSGGADAGFQVYTKTKASVADEETKKKNYEYKCDETDNDVAYAALTSGENKTGAVKAGKAYIGIYETTHEFTNDKGEAKTRKSVADKAAMIMRNVTLNIYSEDMIPVLHLDNKSEVAKLSVIDEKTGNISDITPSGIDSYGNPYYEMQRQENSYWYTLSFSAPDAISREGFDGLEKFCGLAEKTEDGCSWLKNLVNKQTSNDWEADLTPAFNGKVWGKYDYDKKELTFYSAQDEAAKITLAMLKALLESDGVNAISKTEGEGYTQTTWSVFYKAKIVAEDLVASNSTQPDSYVSVDISSAYVGLKDAVKNMEEQITLAMLNELLKSEEVTTITTNGKESYTEASWNDFEKAKADAQTVAAKYEEDGESCENDEISEAYEALQDAVKNMQTVGADDTITLYYYSKELNAYTDSEAETYHLYMSTWDKNKIASSKDEVQLSQGEWDYTAYLFDEVTDEAVNMGYKNWYSVPVKVIAANDGEGDDGFIIQTGKAVVDGGKTTHAALESNAALIKLSYWDNSDIYSQIASMEKGGSIAIKDGKAFGSIQEAEDATNITKKLQDLVNQAKLLKEEDYKKGWAAFLEALKAAEDVLKAAEEAEEDATKEAPTEAQINKAYDDLKKTMDALVSVSAVESDINVQKVALNDNFITGADLSSYISLRDSGVQFKDENGDPLSDAEFFSYLKAGGTNWVRIRVWNDPYDSSGRGYGGGNNDLEKAKTIGKLATDAGMRVLIDFHYSDFWADPAKQDAPKAWQAYSLDEKVTAVHDYTLSSLQSLKAAGVDVGMVQVGNETNNGICGEKTTNNMVEIFNAGSSAVREFDRNCLVAIHFTNPEKGNYASVAEKFSKVDYDVFASSYYPFWHGTTANLTEQLAYVAKKGKKVMVAETSWVTTWDDGDGHENTAPRLTQDLDYDISLQGQADEIRDVVAATNAVNSVEGVTSGSAIGVFYWEPAWISPYYVYDEDGKRIDSLYKQNQALWEQYGSGWASSYAADYDPGDAGKWYGGSAIDNQAWFDFDGTALATAKIYSLIRTGAEAELAITSVESKLTREVVVGSKFTYPQVTAKYNDGTSVSLDVTWDADEQELVNLYKMGEYIVHGIVSDGNKEYKVTLTIKVIRKSDNNVLVNPGFEDDKDNITKHTGWDITPESSSVVSTKPDDWKENPRNGDYAMNFWFEKAGTFTVSQTIEKPEAGTYSFGGYIQGDGADLDDVQYLIAEVRDKDGNLKSSKRATFTLNGWRNWSEPEITGITVSDGDKITVGATILSSKDGAWGSMDDFYLYGTHSIFIADGIQNGTVVANVVKANSGEKVSVTVTPNSGYSLDTLTLSGASVKSDTLTSGNGTVTYEAASGDVTENKVILTYTDKTAEEKIESFTMPNGNVTVSATFASIFEGEQKIKLDAKGADGKYLVQVNVEESDSPDGENPIPAQFYTGKNVTPAVELSYKGYKLTSADYTVSYENNRDITTPDSKAKITLTAKGDKFDGTRDIFFEIKEDTRNDFNAKKLKVVFESSDKNGRTDKAAQAVYYLGKEKEIEPEISLYNVTDDIADKEKAIAPELYKVYYQNNKKIGKATLVVLPSETALNSPDGYKDGSITTTFTIAKCPINQDRVVIETVSDQNYYTGSKVEPSTTVKYRYPDQNGVEKTVTLVRGTDYTVTYTNNVNASVYEVGNKKYQNINDKKVPTVKITGKGNFAGVRTTYDLKDGSKAGNDKITFQIRPRSITNTTITVADLAEKTSAQAPKITVKDGAKTVAASQYVIDKIVMTHDRENKLLTEAETIYSRAKNEGTPKVTAAGTYEITIAGKERSNYTDTKDVSKASSNDKLTFRVVDSTHLIANAKIAISGKFYYTGKAITLSTEGDNSNLTVSCGTGANSTKLTAQRSGSTEGDYYVRYSNNVNAGKATVTITGTGAYAGTKTATFTINKRTIAKTVSDNDKDKKGEMQTPKLSINSAKEQLDAVWIEEATGALTNSDDGSTGSLKVPYTGYTISPSFEFNSKNYNIVGEAKTDALRASDYTVSYKVGAWTADGTAPVTATVKGKGNYSGSVKFDNLFILTARDFTDLSIEVAPVTYNGKAQKPAITFYDKNGKVVDLKNNTAYTVTYKNNKDSKVVNTNPNKQPTVTVKPKGKGWASTANSVAKELNFTIDQAEITKTDIEDVKFQTFLGKALKPKVTVKVNGIKLKEGRDYTLTYSGNVKRGSEAKVMISGKGNYFTRQPIEKKFVIK